MGEETFKVAQALKLVLSIQTVQFGVDPRQLFGVSLRKNPKRSFLFTSKVLGKHYPMEPVKLLAISSLLSKLYQGEREGGIYKDSINQTKDVSFAKAFEKIEKERILLEEPTLFIGFAETATGLSQALFQCFSGDIYYVNTTRVELEDASVDFSEDHSHAATHFLYLEQIAAFMEKCERICIIDDELTTGNTIMHLIDSLGALYGKKKYCIFSILDWRGEKEQKALHEFECKHGIEIKVLSILSGSIVECRKNEVIPAPNLVNADYKSATFEQLDFTDYFPKAIKNKIFQGRLPLSFRQQEKINSTCAQIAKKIKPYIKGEPLFLGTGEFIYIPLLIAGFAEGKAFHSTTQSPILPFEAAGSAIFSGAAYQACDIYSPRGYIYNVKKDSYDSVFIIVEKQLAKQDGIKMLSGYLYAMGIMSVTVIYL